MADGTIILSQRDSEPSSVPASSTAVYSNTDGHVYSKTNTGVAFPVGLAYLSMGRLTLESGSPVSTTDQVDKTNVYFTPYNGNIIDIYDGTNQWVRHTFSELTLAVGGFTASKPYDIFIYDNAGTLTLSGEVWTNATTRATALTTQDGVYVKTGATNYRYLGTIYIDSGQKCQDTYSKRFVYNAYNTVPKVVIAHNTTASWNYTTAAWRESNNGTNQVRGQVVIGLEKDLAFSFGSYFYIVNSSVSTAYEAVGIDAVDGSVQACPLAVNDAGIISVQGGDSMQFNGVGYHFITSIEYGQTTSTFYASAGEMSTTGGIRVGAVRAMVRV